MKKIKLIIDDGKCKSCGLCIIECKENLLDISEKSNSSGYHPIYIKDQSKCTGCTMCAIACPDCAIEIVREG